MARRRRGSAAEARSSRARAAAHARWRGLSKAQRAASIRKSWATRRKVAKVRARLEAAAEREAEGKRAHRRALAKVRRIGALRNVVVLDDELEEETDYRLVAFVDTESGFESDPEHAGRRIQLPMLLEVGKPAAIEKWTRAKIARTFRRRYPGRDFRGTFGTFAVAGRGEAGFVEHARRGRKRKRPRKARRRK